MPPTHPGRQEQQQNNTKQSKTRTFSKHFRNLFFGTRASMLCEKNNSRYISQLRSYNSGFFMCVFSLDVFCVPFEEVNCNTDKRQVRILEAHCILKVSWGSLVFPSLAQMFVLLYVNSKENRLKQSIS